MKALKATVTVLLDPRVIGPEATTEWGGPLAYAAACDWMSAVMSEANSDTVLDWGYEGDSDGEGGTQWHVVDVPDDYEEGDMFAQAVQS